MFALTLSWPTALAQAVSVLWTYIFLANYASYLWFPVGSTLINVALKGCPGTEGGLALRGDMSNNAPIWLHTPTPYTTWKSLTLLKYIKSYITLHTTFHKLYNFKSCHTSTHLVPNMAPRKLQNVLETSFAETGR